METWQIVMLVAMGLLALITIVLIVSSRKYRFTLSVSKWRIKINITPAQAGE